MYIAQWFMTAFTMTLPWNSVLRVWDVFYFEGVKVFYRISLAILEIVKGMDYCLRLHDGGGKALIDMHCTRSHPYILSNQLRNPLFPPAYSSQLPHTRYIIGCGIPYQALQNRYQTTC